MDRRVTAHRLLSSYSSGGTCLDCASYLYVAPRRTIYPPRFPLNRLSRRIFFRLLALGYSARQGTPNLNNMADTPP